MPHLDDLKAKRDRLQESIEMTTYQYFLEHGCIAANGEGLRAELMSVNKAIAEEEKKRIAAEKAAQQTRSDYRPPRLRSREEYDDYLYRGAVQRADAERRERSHRDFHRQFPGLDCERERR